MPSVYPGAIDALTNPVAADTMTAVQHAAQHAAVNDAVEAIEGELGTDPAGGFPTVRARLDAADQLTGTLAGPQSWLFSLYFV
jgi:hypothetical protein